MVTNKENLRTIKVCILLLIYCTLCFEQYKSYIFCLLKKLKIFNLTTIHHCYASRSVAMSIRHFASIFHHFLIIEIKKINEKI